MSENEMGLNDFIDMVMNSDLSEGDFKESENENDFYDRFIALGRKSIKAYNNAPKTIVPNIPVFKRIQKFEKVLNEYVQHRKEVQGNNLFGYDDQLKIVRNSLTPHDIEIEVRCEDLGTYKDPIAHKMFLQMIQLADSIGINPGANDTVLVAFIFENAFIIQLQK